MSNADICALGGAVRQATTDDAYLCMWACRSLMPEALEVIRAWGFRYVTELITWVKTTPKGKIFKGPGAYSLSNTEPLLLARKLPRGHNKKCNGENLCKCAMSPLWHNNKKGCMKISQILMAPHPRDDKNKIIHSRKPAEVHEMLENWLFPYLGEHEALEMFATQHRPGWVCMGHALSGKLLDEEMKERYS